MLGKKQFSLIISLFCIAYLGAQQSFEQGFFELDKAFTERIEREYKPIIKNVQVYVVGYNDKGYWKLASEMFSEPIYKINEVSIRFNLDRIYVKGDLDYIINSKVNVRVINATTGHIVLDQDVDFDINNVNFDSDKSIAAEMTNFDQINAKDRLTVQIRYNKFIVWDSSPKSFTLFTFINKKPVTIYLD